MNSGRPQAAPVVPANRTNSATFQILEPVRQGLDLYIKGTQSGGMALLAQLDR